MDTLLQGGDFAKDHRGLPRFATPHEEILQRAIFRLHVRRGAFAPNPALGSRLYRLPRGNSETLAPLARAYVEETLAPMANLRVERVDCRYDSDRDCLLVCIGLVVEGTDYLLEVNI